MIKKPTTLEINYMDTSNLYIGCRVSLANTSSRRFSWWYRVWLWLTKQNWRIQQVKGSTVILERCR